MDSDSIVFDCCDHACFDDVLDGFNKDKLSCVEVSSLLGEVQLSAGVWKLINLRDKSCFELHSSVCSSLEPSSNGGVDGVACGVKYCLFLAIARDNLARPEFTVGCLLCVVTGITTEERWSV